MPCYVCDSIMIAKLMTMVFHIDDMTIVIKNVPGYECPVCHEQIMDKKTSKQVMKILDEAKQKILASKEEKTTVEYVEVAA